MNNKTKKIIAEFLKSVFGSEFDISNPYYKALWDTLPFIIDTSLTKKQKETVKLRMDGLTMDAIAQRCGVTQPTIFRRYETAMKTLKHDVKIAKNAIDNYKETESGE